MIVGGERMKVAVSRVLGVFLTTCLITKIGNDFGIR